MSELLIAGMLIATGKVVFAYAIVLLLKAALSKGKHGTDTG